MSLRGVIEANSIKSGGSMVAWPPWPTSLHVVSSLAAWNSTSLKSKLIRTWLPNRNAQWVKGFFEVAFWFYEMYDFTRYYRNFSPCTVKIIRSENNVVSSLAAWNSKSFKSKFIKPRLPNRNAKWGKKLISSNLTF